MLRSVTFHLHLVINHAQSLPYTKLFFFWNSLDRNVDKRDFNICYFSISVAHNFSFINVSIVSIHLGLSYPVIELVNTSDTNEESMSFV